VRASRQRRDHLIAVIGDAELADGTVQVTDIAGGFRGPVGAGDVLDRVRNAYENRLAHVAWEKAPEPAY
jgi:threonyl-tRNA synthetase